MAVTQPTLLVTVDRTKCCGYTLCATEGPDVYSIDDAGYALAMEGVPAELEAQACRGADACPDGAITVRRLGSGDHQSTAGRSAKTSDQVQVGSRFGQAR